MVFDNGCEILSKEVQGDVVAATTSDAQHFKSPQLKEHLRVFVVKLHVNLFHLLNGFQVFAFFDLFQQSQNHFEIVIVLVAQLLQFTNWITRLVSF